MRDDDKKIAGWLGWVNHRGLTTGFVMPYSYWMDGGIRHEQLPFFTTSDSDAITLPPVLVERYKALQFKWVLESQTQDDCYHCSLAFLEDKLEWFESGWQPTISAAITSAILQLIDKEKQLNV